MINADSLTEIKNILQQTRSAIIFIKANPNLDQILTAFALANSLENSEISVELACTDYESVDVSTFSIDLSILKKKIGNQNLTISFPYREDAVEHVSYHISDDSSRFYLVVKPQRGSKPLDSNEVEFDYSGIDTDLIFTVGVHDWDQLEYLYSEQESLFSKVPVVSVHTFAVDTTRLQINTEGFNSLSEGLVWFLEGLGLQPNSEGATYLLQGIEASTDSFKSLATTADTFESVAKLMRLGARRVRLNQNKIDTPLQKSINSNQLKKQPFSLKKNPKKTTIIKKSNETISEETGK